MSVVYLFVTGVAAFYCCLGLWAAVSQRHWFLRASVVLAMLALLVPIRAYEPLVLFGLTTAMLVAGMMVARWCGRRKQQPSAEAESTIAASRYRFSLADLFLLLIAAGAASWLVSVLVAAGIQISWWRYLLAAIAFALLTASAAGVILWPPRWKPLLMLVVAVPGAIALDRFVLGDWLYAGEVLWIWRDPMFSSRYGLDSLAWLYGDFVVWVAVLTLVAAFVFRQNARWTTAHIALRAFVALLFLPMMLLGSATYWHMLGSSPPPAYDAQFENNLPRIMQLAENLPNASPRTAKLIYGELLPLLEKPGFAGIDWRLVMQDHGSAGSLPMDSIRDYRELARQLHREGELRAKMGLHDEAADFALANVRYAAMIDREGLLIHRLVAEAIFGMGYAALAREREQITPAKAAEVARVLASIAKAREPIEATIARDELWSDLSQGWRYRLSRAMDSQVWGLPPMDITTNTYASLHTRSLTLAELFTIDLALRAYRADHGAWPQSLSELAPQYLEQVPRDRYSGKELIYSAELNAPHFTLYSVGEGGVDDGGKFVNKQNYWPGRTGFDLDIDTLIRP